MNFLGAVNRIMVNNFILKGDDDLLTTFSDNQHEATTRVAINAVQTELNNFTSYFNIPYEKTSGSIVTVAGTRTYLLPSDFVRFYGDNPYLVNNADDSDRIYEYKGGENSLRQADYTYLTTQGGEHWWYWNDNTNKEIALYQVPDGARTYSFDYERDISVTNATDTMPFQTEQEAQAFADMASRRFKYIVEEQDLADLEKDVEYGFNRSTLMNLLRNRNMNTRYGKQYR